jgi:hypothetical protein
MAFLTQNTQTRKVNPKKIAIFHQKFVKIGKNWQKSDNNIEPMNILTLNQANYIPIHTLTK